MQRFRFTADAPKLRRILPWALALVALAAPGSASAADTVVVPGDVAPRITALDGHVVWLTGTHPNMTLMHRDAAGVVAPVPGAPTGPYRSIDLGKDTTGGLVLTYLRCISATQCTAYSDDLAGHRTSFKKLVPARCALSSAPARWMSRVAYHLSCSKLGGAPHRFSPTRSGLFVRQGAGAAKRVGLPPRTREDTEAADNGGWVDLRGTAVGASASGLNFVGAYTQTVAGKHLRLAGHGWDEGTEGVAFAGASLGAGGVLWTLYTAPSDVDPNASLIDWLKASCEGSETLPNPVGPNQSIGFPATAIAVDGNTMYLYAPGTGIVAHTVTPAPACP